LISNAVHVDHQYSFERKDRRGEETAAAGRQDKTRDIRHESEAIQWTLSIYFSIERFEDKEVYTFVATFM